MAIIDLITLLIASKIPKLLLHRLFPNVRYSVWIDGKLKLVRDPYQIVERFLWRENATFAISRHYKRFDVFVEAEANKVGGKYDNASIDYQVDFYRKEGLTPYSEAKLPITSDVPEGCVIVREHIPITNLFTCQWFNEVDRFTSRDQLSFSTVRDKIMAKVNWSVNMFLDCERWNFVLQAYHRDLLEHMPPPLPRIKQHRLPRVQPSTTANREIAVGRASGRKVTSKCGRRSGSRGRPQNYCRYQKMTNFAEFFWFGSFPCHSLPLFLLFSFGHLAGGTREIFHSNFLQDDLYKHYTSPFIPVCKMFREMK